jgi:uncharacterized protein with FMN-binding domain
MSTVRKVAIILVCIAALFYFTGCEAIEEIEKLTIEDISIKGVGDGDYKGSQDNFPVTAEVLVTVKDGRITGIKLLGHSHGPGHGADEIVGRVIAKQSLMVDAVTGASYSSKVVLKAIEKALKQGE